MVGAGSLTLDKFVIGQKAALMNHTKLLQSGRCGAIWRGKGKRGKAISDTSFAARSAQRGSPQAWPKQSGRPDGDGS